MKLYKLSKTKFENIEIVIIDDLMNREYLIDGLNLKDAKLLWRSEYYEDMGFILHSNNTNIY